MFYTIGNDTEKEVGMAIIQNAKGQMEVSWEILQDIKMGWCRFCDPAESDIKQIGHCTYECKHCDTEFTYNPKLDA